MRRLTLALALLALGLLAGCGKKAEQAGYAPAVCDAHFIYSLAHWPPYAGYSQSHAK